MDYNKMFEGFQSTPLLWENDCIYNMKQFLPKSTTNLFTPKAQNLLPLGKWVEKFVSFQLQQQSDCQIIAENIQVKQSQHTIGELDLLFHHHNQSIHLEIIYKFYLYHPKLGNLNNLQCWIGPNKKDSLIYKLERLQNKQLPLLYNQYTKDAVNSKAFDFDSANQCVCFKAQLYLPIELNRTDINPLNKACIVGYYIPFTKIDILKNALFYIPKKLEWLIIPHSEVIWINFESAKFQIKKLTLDKKSPMIWVKNQYGEITKYFVTWW